MQIFNSDARVSNFFYIPLTYTVTHKPLNIKVVFSTHFNPIKGYLAFNNFLKKYCILVAFPVIGDILEY